MEKKKYLFKSKFRGMTVTLPKLTVKFINHTFGTNDEKIAEQLRGRSNIFEIPNDGPVEVPKPESNLVHGRVTTESLGQVPAEAVEPMAHAAKEPPKRRPGRPRKA